MKESRKQLTKTAEMNTNHNVNVVTIGAVAVTHHAAMCLS